MATQQIFISTRAAFGPLKPGRDGVRQLVNWLQSVEVGALEGTVSAGCDDTAMAAGTDSIMGRAVGLLTLSSGSGALAVTAASVAAGGVTWATSDNASAAALAANINATSLTVQATVELAKVTVGAGVTDGETVTVNGVTFTRQASSPAATSQQFSNAAGLALAINLCPALANKYRAISASTAVYVFNLRPVSVTAPTAVLTGAGANITVNVQSPTAANLIAVYAREPGALGNLLTLGVTGTGLAVTTAITYGNGNMVGSDFNAQVLL